MKKVFNLRIECNSPTFVMTDKEFCQGLEEVVADEFDEEMKYVKLKAEPCDKDEQLAIYKRALELACGVIRQYVQIVYNDNVDRLPNLTNLEDYYLQVAKYGVYKGETHQIYEPSLDQAKKELEEEE